MSTKNIFGIGPYQESNIIFDNANALSDDGKGIFLLYEKQKNKAGEWFLSFFDKVYRSMIKGILDSGRYIPQEILDNSEFMKLICRNSQDEGTSHV